MTLVDALTQFLRNALESMHISSAGGDSPKINYLRDVDINPADFDEIIRNEVERIITEREQEIKAEESTIETKVGSGAETNGGGGFESGAIGAVRTGTGLAQNPASSIGMLMRFIPHAALVALVLSMLPIIIKELKRPGSVMDVRWKRAMAEEFNAFLDRQDQMNTFLGYRQVIVQSRAGFIAQSSGAGTYDSNRDLREGGMDKDRQEIVGLKDHAKQLPWVFYNG